MSIPTNLCLLLLIFLKNKTNEIKRKPKLSGHENKQAKMKKKLQEEGNKSKLKINELFKPINKFASMNIAGKTF